MRRIIQFANYFGKLVDKFAIGFFFYFLAGSKFISLGKKINSQNLQDGYGWHVTSTPQGIVVLLLVAYDDIPSLKSFSKKL